MARQIRWRWKGDTLAAANGKIYVMGGFVPGVEVSVTWGETTLTWNNRPASATMALGGGTVVPALVPYALAFFAVESRMNAIREPPSLTR